MNMLYVVYFTVIGHLGGFQFFMNNHANTYIHYLMYKCDNFSRMYISRSRIVGSYSRYIAAL